MVFFHLGCQKEHPTSVIAKKALEYWDKGNLKLGFVKWIRIGPQWKEIGQFKKMCQLVKCVALYRHEGSFILSTQGEAVERSSRGYETCKWL